MNSYYQKPGFVKGFINCLRNWKITKCYIERYGVIAVLTTLGSDKMLPPPLKCWAEPRGWPRKHKTSALVVK